MQKFSIRWATVIWIAVIAFVSYADRYANWAGIPLFKEH